ncbi:Aldehyde reductase Ahr [Poriferisphaera corsica]|uniref:alcohol dehydrogenase (NADP(+)) n=1 Tax=Poriferisphaera corsica TaxID=2528020 RepID=A0A517YQI1_9BACT|nr:NAD(P)-dependent alcohol dehydrogenase [Poriferisphaera corsica]QDU32474.1 Aldehyde reductase Ahr [Poriferisphaera corsica]
MSKVYHGYAAMEQGGELERIEYEVGELGGDEVEVKVTHCGICHSDLAMIDNEWGNTKYPQVPGHEVVGVVSEVGAHVGHLTVGQRVGLGWQSGSCGCCEWCNAGDENLCATTSGTIVGRHGGFADYVRAEGRFVVPLPEGLDAVNASPLLCAGITAFNPFVEYGITATDRVGVVGIGGLGHLAIQFSRAYGCHVTAFSSTADKEMEARELGADGFVVSREPGNLKVLARSFDLLLVTANADLDWSLYASMLRPRGNMCFVGIPPSKLSVHVFDLISGQHCLSGSPIGSPKTIGRMFDLAVQHQIGAVTEEFAFKDVNKAIARLRENKVRYRAVLVHE